jgi:acyl-coenzyme A synthetase/AMP-(fatty) acid ligase
VSAYRETTAFAAHCKFFHELREADLVFAFPVFWKSFLSIGIGPGRPTLPSGLYGVTSAAPCPPEVIEGLLPKGLLTGMTEICGATEFGAVGLRMTCCLTGAWNGSLQRRKKRNGAYGGPAARPCRFRPVGCKDRAVQVSGVNVLPSHVEEVLRAHPGVRDCAVRLMRPGKGMRYPVPLAR